MSPVAGVPVLAVVVAASSGSLGRFTLSIAAFMIGLGVGRLSDRVLPRGELRRVRRRAIERVSGGVGRR